MMLNKEELYGKRERERLNPTDKQTHLSLNLTAGIRLTWRKDERDPESRVQAQVKD